MKPLDLTVAADCRDWLKSLSHEGHELKVMMFGGESESIDSIADNEVIEMAQAIHHQMFSCAKCLKKNSNQNVH